MKIVCDLDGTLCTITFGDYKQAKPFSERIARLNEATAAGHTVEVFTARGMGTFRGLRILAYLKWYRLTRRQLASWGLNYNRLTLGKPSGDLYIDDKALLPNDFFSD